VINTSAFVKKLIDRGVRLFTGVPDSLLKNFSSELQNNLRAQEHIIAANEGNAVGLAMGHFLATGNPAVVYLQNSGLGNAVNPLVSLADPEIYSVPMLLIVGWRGEPGKDDEPQHLKQGRITCEQLKLLEIPHWVVDADTDIEGTLSAAWQVMQNEQRPAALVVKENSFSEVKLATFEEQVVSTLLREAAINQLLNALQPNDCVFATTGKTGRELFELREKRIEPQQDFLTVGGMGHATSIALGVALAQPQRRVVCLDGDGALLMHLGAMPIIGNLYPRNFLHVLLNNRAHESVGGQPTVAGKVNFSAIASGCGYQHYLSASSLEEIDGAMQKMTEISGPVLLEIHLCQGSRKELGRPTRTPQQNKKALMRHLGIKQ
jgi:phosphonopyruvate decarboxylase